MHDRFRCRAIVCGDRRASTPERRRADRDGQSWPTRADPRAARQRRREGRRARALPGPHRAGSSRQRLGALGDRSRSTGPVAAGGIGGGAFFGSAFCFRWRAATSPHRSSSSSTCSPVAARWAAILSGAESGTRCADSGRERGPAAHEKTRAPAKTVRRSGRVMVMPQGKARSRPCLRERGGRALGRRGAQFFRGPTQLRRKCAFVYRGAP